MSGGGPLRRSAASAQKLQAGDHECTTCRNLVKEQPGGARLRRHHAMYHVAHVFCNSMCDSNLGLPAQNLYHLSFAMLAAGYLLATGYQAAPQWKVLNGHFSAVSIGAPHRKVARD